MFSYERSVAIRKATATWCSSQRGIRPLPRLPKWTRPLPEGAPDTQMLYRYLRQFNGIVASHTRGTNMGTDWRDNDPRVEPVVEIYQGDRQNYEMPGAPRSNTANDSIGGWRPKGFVNLALEKGYKLGFQASSRPHLDAHELLQLVRAGRHARGRSGRVPEAARVRRDRQHPGRRALRRAHDGRRVHDAARARVEGETGGHRAVRQGPHGQETTSTFTPPSPSARRWSSPGATTRRRRARRATTTSAASRKTANIVWASPMWITYTGK